MHWSLRVLLYPNGANEIGLVEEFDELENEANDTSPLDINESHIKVRKG